MSKYKEKYSSKAATARKRRKRRYRKKLNDAEFEMKFVSSLRRWKHDRVVCTLFYIILMIKLAKNPNSIFRFEGQFAMCRSDPKMKSGVSKSWKVEFGGCFFNFSIFRFSNFRGLILALNGR
jgi:hypothetical protein